MGAGALPGPCYMDYAIMYYISQSEFLYNKKELFEKTIIDQYKIIVDRTKNFKDKLFNDKL